MKKYVLSGIVTILFAVTGCFHIGPCIQGYGPVITEVRETKDFTGVTNTGSFDVKITRTDTFGVAVEAQENLMGLIETYVSGSNLIVKFKNGTCVNSRVPVIVRVSMPEITEMANTGSGSLTADETDTEEFEMVNSGSGFISIYTVSTIKASLKNTGSGKLFVDQSNAIEVHITQTGSGHIDAGIINDATTVNINHTSSGEVAGTLLDGQDLDVRLSGSGKVILKGDAVDAVYSLSSSGKIDALDLVVSEAKVTVSGSGKVYVHATDFLDVIITSSGVVLYLGSPDIRSTITGSGSIRSYNY